MDKEPFRDLMKYLRPGLRESDMLHRTKTHTEIMERARLVVDRINDKLQVCCRISFHLFLLSSIANVQITSTSIAKYL